MSYFPGTPDFTKATTVLLKAGESKRIAFALAEIRAFTVFGIAYDVAGKPFDNADVSLTADTELKWMSGATRTAADGTFVLTGVPPGRYVLRVWRQGSAMGEVHFDVDEADVKNLVVHDGPPRSADAHGSQRDHQKIGPFMGWT
jgi:hypothetical protein